jgi:hypothetical protein
MLSYVGIFIGFPLSLVPLIQKDNAFALYHARHATASWIVYLILAVFVFVITMVTCGLGAVLMPLMFLPWITAIHGLTVANNGEWREPFGVFGLGDKFFGSLQPNPPPVLGAGGYAPPPHGGAPPGPYGPPGGPPPGP